ncbi:hypothetical protein U1Q18_005764, partial [Sarracenia purpurea var. burkii]
SKNLRGDSLRHTPSLEPTRILQATARIPDFPQIWLTRFPKIFTTARSSSSGASSVDGKDPDNQPYLSDFFSGTESEDGPGSSTSTTDRTPTIRQIQTPPTERVPMIWFQIAH